MNTRFINCETCQTEGRILTNNGGPDDVDHGVCPACNGERVVEVETEPVSLEEFDNLIGRAIADGASVPTVIKSIRDRNEIEAAVMPCACFACGGTGAVPARDGIEAQWGLNDTFPGDPYPCSCRALTVPQPGGRSVAGTERGTP